MTSDGGMCEECGTDVGETSDLIDDLIRERDELRDAARWQPIETAPKDGTSVLISSTNWRTTWRGYYRAQGFAPEQEIDNWGEGWTRENYSDIGLIPTHWMPLPEPPK
jgi:hypothetical protein